MAGYFIPKSRLMSRAINFRPVPSKWHVRWTMVQRTFTNKSQGAFGQQTTAAIGGGQQDRTHQKKGKFKYLRKNWSWKAGAGWTVLSILDWWLLATGGWFTWYGLFTRWTPLGVCIMAAMEWQLHKKHLQREGLPRTASQLQTNIYCSLPLRLFSRCWGWLADCSVPTSMRPFVYGAYSNAFGVNLDEAANPELKNYRSLAEFFTRELKENVRCIDDVCCLVSPADGKVLHFGLAANAQIEQVKGVTYNLEAFLGPLDWIDKENDNSYANKIKEHKDEDTSLFQCIIYLAPGDYHRFHSPTYWEPKIRRHFTGELLSVSPKIAEWVPGLFCLNERALYIGKWQHGFFSFTAVGATNVGSVQIYFDDKLKTNQWKGFKLQPHKIKEFDELKIETGIKLKKGELIGQFNMGSTIVLVFEAPKDFKFNISSGQKIKMGERLGFLSHEVLKAKENAS